MTYSFATFRGQEQVEHSVLLGCNERHSFIDDEADKRLAQLWMVCLHAGSEGFISQSGLNIFYIFVKVPFT